jgi:hypothetical protein
LCDGPGPVFLEGSVFAGRGHEPSGAMRRTTSDAPLWFAGRKRAKALRKLSFWSCRSPRSRWVGDYNGLHMTSFWPNRITSADCVPPVMRCDADSTSSRNDAHETGAQQGGACAPQSRANGHFALHDCTVPTHAAAFSGRPAKRTVPLARLFDVRTRRDSPDVRAHERSDHLWPRRHRPRAQRPRGHARSCRPNSVG